MTDLDDNQRWSLYSRWLDHDDPTIRANAIICLIHQTNYLLDQQIDALERQFIDDGGYSEQLATARLQKRADLRSKPNSAASSAQAADNVNQSPSPPACPICGGLMSLRTAKSGRNPGSQFWGCCKYPDCKGVASL